MKQPRTSASILVRSFLVVTAALALAAGAVANAAEKPAPTLRDNFREAATPEACALLDDPQLAGRMDGLLRTLAIGCGREAEFLGGVIQEDDGRGGESDDPQAVDVPVSNPAQDTSGNALTQSETSLAFDPVDNVLCAAWNDSFHGVTQGTGFSGFARSTNNGATWTDFGAVNPVAPLDVGDPSLVWRQSDGHFYYAALHQNGGLGLWRSTDNCQDFAFVSQIASSGDDKEIMAADNNPTSPHFGNLYVAWTDFGAGATIHFVRSTNAGTNWSAPMSISAAGEDVQGAWPVVAPNGDVFVAWVHWMAPGFPNGNIEVEVERSTNGGVSFAPVTFPVTNKVNPRDSTATGNCGRPALGGNIRYLPSPQIAIDGAGNLHVVYSYDPNAFNVGDESDVFYRRSTNQGASWEPEILINDDGGTTDQWFPSLSVGAGGIVTVGYYSRQNDVAGNLLFDYYSRTSFNNGTSFSPSVRLSDASSTVILDPNLATCYHGDYDTQIHSVGQANYLWSDDRDPAGAPPASPNVYTESTPAGTDYLLVPDPASRTVCATAGSTTYDIDILQFNGFAQPIDLSAANLPGAATASFSPDPAPTPSTSVLTVGNLGSVPSGTYSITVDGSSIPGGIAHSTQISLELFAAAPTATTLTLPANSTSGHPLRPDFVWNAVAGAVDYELQVDDTADFSSPIISVTLTGTTHTPASDLPPTTLFFWRVRASNICGDAPFSAVFRFATGSPGEACSGPITLPDAAPAVPYPAVATISGVAGTVATVQVEINDYTHTFPDDIDMLLVGPSGQELVIASDIGGADNISGVDLVLDDAAAALLPDGGPLVSGSFRPSNVDTADTFPVPAPPPPYGQPAPAGGATLTSIYGGDSPNGTWSLYIVDDAGIDIGSIGSFCVVFANPDSMPFLDGFETNDTSRWSSAVP